MSARRRAAAAGRGIALALLSAAPVAAWAQPASSPATASAPGAAAPAQARRGQADLGTTAASTEARRLADWIVVAGDSRGLPFVIVDKAGARVLAFDGTGRLVGTAPALLGLARADDNPPGIGSLRLAQITPAMRVTPAGRFEAHLGANLAGRDVLWVDYDAALSLHRVATSNAAEHRLQRLATPTVDDNRISYGCINVPAAFYEDVILPLFTPADGLVYIMPETRRLETAFDMPQTVAGND